MTEHVVTITIAFTLWGRLRLWFCQLLLLMGMELDEDAIGRFIQRHVRIKAIPGG